MSIWNVESTRTPSVEMKKIRSKNVPLLNILEREQGGARTMFPKSLIVILFLALLAVAAQNEKAQLAREGDDMESNMSATSETRVKPVIGDKKKLTRAEMEALAAKLDKQIFHLSHQDFAKGVSKDTWLVFWGAKWCKFCQRLTPKWNKLQSKVYERLGTDYRFYVAKVDCTEDEQFCGKYGIDAFPTIILYNKGQPVEEYSSEPDVKSMFEYAQAMARKYYEYNTGGIEDDDHDEL